MDSVRFLTFQKKLDPFKAMRQNHDPLFILVMRKIYEYLPGSCVSPVFNQTSILVLKISSIYPIY